MEELKYKMESFRHQCHIIMSMKIQKEPNYLDSVRHNKDINNHRIIWQCVDDIKKIEPNDELNIWAKTIIKKINEGVEMQWDIIDEINDKFKFPLVSDYTKTYNKFN